jgi:hypothetical protein
VNPENINAYNAMALIGILALLIFYGWRQFFYGRNECALEEKALRIPCFWHLWALKVPYNKIEKVEVVPFGKYYFSIFFFFDYPSLHSITRLASSVVVITRKHPAFFKSIVFTPKNMTIFIEQLKNRIKVATS